MKALTLFLIIGLLSGLRMPVAHASKAEASIADTLQGDARKAYRLGVVLYDDGDWSGALAQFETAHKLSADPRLLWNMAVCEKNRRRYTKALTLVDAYIEARAKKMQPRELRDAKGFRDTVEKLTRLIRLRVNQDGAAVAIDGEPVGTTPLADDVRVDVAEVEISIEKAGFVPLRLKLAADQPPPALIELEADAGRLVVKVNPTSAAISIDGKHVAFGLFDDVRPSGPAFVKVAASGMQTFQNEVVVTRGETRTVDVTLEPVAPRRMWAWIGAGAVMLGAAAVTAYVVSNPTVERPPIQEGSWATVRLGK